MTVWFVSHAQLKMNGEKLVIKPETGHGQWATTALVLFCVIHPGMAATKVDTFWQSALHFDVRDIETEQERERGSFNKY